MQFMLNSKNLLHHKVLLIFEYSWGQATLRRIVAPFLVYSLQLIVMITKVLKRFLIVAVCFVSNCYAADYVDEINNSMEKREEGHRVIYEMNVG